MPARKTPLINNYIYHIYNRGVEHRDIFLDQRDYKRAYYTIKYYMYFPHLLKYSRYLDLSNKNKDLYYYDLEKKSSKLVEIISYCLMPNHFHFQLKQLYDSGVSKFMSNFQNSYTRYFNTKNDRNGHLFQGQFKSKIISSDSLLLHVSRYIHLNPYTSAIVRSLDELVNYKWSSFGEYIKDDINVNICSKYYLLTFFKNKSRNSDYKMFVLDRADYQKKLEHIKHLTLE